MPHKPRIAITLGDPGGIGPEVVLRALCDRGLRSRADFVVFGSLAVLRRVADAYGLGEALQGETGIPVVEGKPVSPGLALRGEPTAEGGRACMDWIEQAVRTALAGGAHAVVTAPISKEALKMAGASWPGHTEMIASLCGTPKPVMMMAADRLRIALATTHAAIADLPNLVTREVVLKTIRITSRELRRRFGIGSPRVAVCGLNPHAGEAGRFGREEERAIRPAIEAAQGEGVHCSGPFPADTLFIPAKRETYDAAVAMYHDQACIPVKMLAFESGVNITLGLPIVRTSPDHGTAYDIVRSGAAHPGSMKAAIQTAIDMALAECGKEAG